MAFNDNEIGLADTAINAALATKEQIHPAPAQFTRQGRTSRWFRPGSKTLQGERTKFRVFTKPYRGARRRAFDTAATSEFPVPMKPGYERLSYSWSDLIDIQGTCKWNMLQDLKHKNLKLSVIALVQELYSQAELDLVHQMNAGIFQSYTCAIAKVAGIYDLDDVDGTPSFSGASGHAAAYIQIKDGSITNFQMGDVLHFYDSTSTGGSDTQNCQVVVHDVIHGENGPWYGGSRNEGYGPGLICEPCAVDGSVTSGTGYDTAWNATGTPADGDFIARSGEFQTSTTDPNNFHGFPDWFDPTVDCLMDEDGSVIDRESTGKHWMNPMVIIPDGASAGSEVEFSVRTHLREVEDNWFAMVAAGRQQRRSIGVGMPGGKEQAIEISEHLTLIMEPKLFNHVADEAQYSSQFTHASALSESAAKALRRIGVDGFEGFVYHSPTLGEIACMADTNCEPHAAYLIEPSSFFWIEPPSGQRATWLQSGGSRVWAKIGDTLGTPTYTRQAAVHMMIGLMNDQPKASLKIDHICTAREAA